jgi:hypothetical protein
LPIAKTEEFFSISIMSEIPWKLLESRFPDVVQRLKKAKALEKNMVVDKTLAAIWAQSQVKHPNPNTLYVVSGWGEHVKALLPRIDATSCVVVYEASADKLLGLLQSDNVEAFLADRRVFLFVGDFGEESYERLHELPIARMTDVVPLRFSLAWQQDEKAYANFFAEFARQFEVTRNLHLTSFHDSFLWQATTLANLPLHAAAPDVGALKGLFSDLPAILVGAGPSLDEAEDFLKSVQNRALIIGVNSSYRKLRKIGVSPHLVLAADPREDTARGFENLPADDGSFLVAPFIVNPQVIKHYGGRAFSWSGTNNVLISLLRKRLGLAVGTAILERGTVSLSVADLALWMGCKDLIMLGQDMAIRHDGLTHTQDSIYNGSKKSAEEMKVKTATENADIRELPGNTLPAVPVTSALFVYLRAFEQWLSAHLQMKVWNTARLGAKVKGATYVNYEQAQAKLAQNSVNIVERLQRAFDNAPERKISFERWKDACAPTLKYARKLSDTALSAAVAVEVLPERFRQSSYRDSREVKTVYQLAETVNSLLDKNAEDYEVVLEGRLKKTLLDYQALQQGIEASNPFAQELMRNCEFFWALAEGTLPTVAALEKID